MDDRRDLFKLHPGSQGLNEEAVQEIAHAAELVRCGPGDVVCLADQRLTSLYLIVHGRLRLQLVDVAGNSILQRFVSAGGQFGAIAAALAEPTPVTCIAEDPSVLLRFDYATALELARKHSVFRTNYLRMLAHSVKQVLFCDKTPVRPGTVAFFHQSEATRIISKSVLQRLALLGEVLSVFADRRVEIDGVSCCPILAANPTMTPEEIRRQAAERLPTGRAVFDVDASVDPAVISRAFAACQQVFWCVTADNWAASVEQLRTVETFAAGWRDKVSIVWLLRSHEEAPLAGPLRELAKRDFKVTLGPLSATQGPIVLEGIDRLVHLLRGIQVGVALGGGAARGMVHLGVLKALQHHGIVVDMIAGTSAGAMAGMVYAAGFDVDFSVKRFVEDLRPPGIFRCLPRGDHWYLLYKYRRHHFDPMLRKYLGTRRIEQLPIPMHAVTVDLVSGRALVRDTGDAVDAILESINLPVLAKPINRNGEALVDGGLIDNVPADVLATKGCNFVIAVSVTAKIEHEFSGNRPDTPINQMRSASTIQTLLRSYLVQAHSVNSIGVQPADFVIEPDVTQFELAAFTRTAELAAVGEQTTHELVPELRRLLNRLDSALFPLSESMET